MRAFGAVHTQVLHNFIMKNLDLFIDRNPNLPKLLEYLQNCGKVLYYLLLVLLPIIEYFYYRLSGLLLLLLLVLFQIEKCFS